jgi:hypothetical protein
MKKKSKNKSNSEVCDPQLTTTTMHLTLAGVPVRKRNDRFWALREPTVGLGVF